MEFHKKNGKLEYPADHIGKRTYVTVAGFDYSVPKIYCYLGSDRRYHLLGVQRADGSISPFVIRDLEPYKSPLDGTMVTSRSYHRDHMRQHGVIEMGNEKPNFNRAPVEIGRAGYDIKRAMGN